MVAGATIYYLYSYIMVKPQKRDINTVKSKSMRQFYVMLVFFKGKGFKM